MKPARALGGSILLVLGVALFGPAAAQETVEKPAPAALPRATNGIEVDGDLSDPAWQSARVIERFYETAFGDNRDPMVKTVAYVTYDGRYFYVGVRCFDPDPSKIRAPYVDRDNVIGTDDNVAVFIDARNDRRTAQEFRVNPRGIQGDAIYYDATQNEDFSPDFYYDTAARITKEGWEAEIRIPLSSLRYGKADPQTWGILLWRNYPRGFRYAIYSSPLPRGSNCTVCHAHELTGLTRLPSSGHLVLAPYVSGQNVAVADPPGSPLRSQGTDGDVGLDLKWNPGANTAIDAAVNPDFSQVEADVAQIAVNQRFALFFPEKRPFFLEGVDLFDTPIQAVYTRTLTSPRWGARVTGKRGASSYTLLVAQDRGGGSVILPGTTGSDFAPQDFRSVVGIGRWRYELGRSFVGVLATNREIEGGGHNRVIGPDFQWRPNEHDVVTAEALFADTRTPTRPELVEEWDGRALRGHGVFANWDRRTRTYDWRLRYRDFSDGFRADEGFVPQVGYRGGRADVGYSLYPKGLLSYVRVYAGGDFAWDRSGSLANQKAFPGVFFLGKRNLQGEIDFDLDRVRTRGALLDRKQVLYFVQVDPSRRFTRVGVNGYLGEQVDFANTRVGRGGSVNIQATLRPSDHLTLDTVSAVDWLNVNRPTGGRGRLFTAQVQRLKATYNFSRRSFLRLIGQYVTTDSDPSLYTFPVPERSGDFQGSALLSYRLTWQTALFIGYGDTRTLDERDRLVRNDRQFFAKLSYAFQR